MKFRPRSLRRAGTADNVSLRGRVARLNRRVTELESEVQECRRLNRRLAELMDVVEELLLPVSQRDEQKIQETLDRYAASL